MAVGKWADGLDVAVPRQRHTAESNQPDTDMDTVPASATCRFVGEGRANVVFTLTGIDDCPTFRGM